MIKDDAVTDAGSYAKEQGLELPEEGYDRDQTPFRKGLSDYIKVGNSEQKLRTWDRVRSEYKYTTLGQKWFRNAVSDWIISIPVDIHGTNKKGKYFLIGYMPVQALGIEKIQTNQTLSREQRIAKIKSTVFKHFEDHMYEDGQLVVYEASSETYLLSKDRAWLISELDTSEDGENVKAVLNRPLKRLPKIWALVPNPLDVCDESIQFHDDVYCVPRSMGSVLGQDWAHIADRFDHLIGEEWRDVGISSAQILQYCEAYDHTAHMFWQSKMIESRKGSKKALCWSVEAGHCFMYRSYKKLLEKTGDVKKERLKKLPKPKPLPQEEFTSVKEGRFYASDLRELRIRLLSENWPVQASLSSPHDKTA